MILQRGNAGQASYLFFALAEIPKRGNACRKMTFVHSLKLIQFIHFCAHTSIIYWARCCSRAGYASIAK